MDEQSQRRFVEEVVTSSRETGEEALVVGFEKKDSHKEAMKKVSVLRETRNDTLDELSNTCDEDKRRAGLTSDQTDRGTDDKYSEESFRSDDPASSDSFITYEDVSGTCKSGSPTAAGHHRSRSETEYNAAKSTLQSANLQKENHDQLPDTHEGIKQDLSQSTLLPAVAAVQTQQDVNRIFPETNSTSTGSAKPSRRKKYVLTKRRKFWTHEEHERFTKALEMYGRDWKSIERHVVTKNAIQIRSHARKYFLKLKETDLEDWLRIPPRRRKGQKKGPKDGLSTELPNRSLDVDRASARRARIASKKEKKLMPRILPTDAEMINTMHMPRQPHSVNVNELHSQNHHQIIHPIQHHHYHKIQQQTLAHHPLKHHLKQEPHVLNPHHQHQHQQRHQDACKAPEYISWQYKHPIMNTTAHPHYQLHTPGQYYPVQPYAALQSPYATNASHPLQTPHVPSPLWTPTVPFPHPFHHAPHQPIPHLYNSPHHPRPYSIHHHQKQSQDPSSAISPRHDVEHKQIMTQGNTKTPAQGKHTNQVQKEEEPSRSQPISKASIGGGQQQGKDTIEKINCKRQNDAEVRRETKKRKRGASLEEKIIVKNGEVQSARERIDSNNQTVECPNRENHSKQQISEPVKRHKAERDMCQYQQGSDCYLQERMLAPKSSSHLDQDKVENQERVNEGASSSGEEADIDSEGSLNGGRKLHQARFKNGRGPYPFATAPIRQNRMLCHGVSEKADELVSARILGLWNLMADS